MSCTNTMLNNTIADTEFLYRGIIEEWYDKENNRISSAAFKDSKGVSVDRDGNRNEKECVKTILSIERKPPRKPFYKVCKLLTKQVRESEAFVKYCPSNSNVFHSEIHNSENEVVLSQRKARILSKIAYIIDC